MSPTIVMPDDIIFDKRDIKILGSAFGSYASLSALPNFFKITKSDKVFEKEDMPKHEEIMQLGLKIEKVMLALMEKCIYPECFEPWEFVNEEYEPETLRLCRKHYDIISNRMIERSKAEEKEIAESETETKT